MLTSWRNTNVHKGESECPRDKQNDGYPGHDVERVSGEYAFVQEGNAKFIEADSWISDDGEGIVDHGEVGGPVSRYRETILVEFCAAT